jgi:hypothetical protein
MCDGSARYGSQAYWDRIWIKGAFSVYLMTLAYVYYRRTGFHHIVEWFAWFYVRIVGSSRAFEVVGVGEEAGIAVDLADGHTTGMGILDTTALLSDCDADPSSYSNCAG